MKKLLLGLFCLSSIAFGQIIKRGEPLDNPSNSEFIVVEENEDYGVTFCPQNFTLNFIVSGLIRNEQATFNFKNEFKLVKHFFPELSAQHFEYECVEESKIVDYRKIGQLFIVLSKYAENEHYYIDAIDLESMKKVVSKKEVIRFRTGEQHISFYIRKKGSTTYELLLKRISNRLAGEFFQYFILDNSFKVLNYQKIPIDKIFYNCKVSVRHNGESTQLVLANTLRNKETQDIKSVYGIFEIYSDRYDYSKFLVAKDVSIVDSKSLGEKGSKLILSVLKSAGSLYIDKISVFDLESLTTNLIDIPEEALAALKKMNVLYLANYDGIKIKKISDYIFSAESYKDVYHENSGTQRIYGPVILFSVSEKNTLNWLKVFTKNDVFEKMLKAEALWVDTDHYIHLVANFGLKGLVMFKIEKSSGFIIKKKELELKEFRVPFISNKRTVSFTDAHFFYITAGNTSSMAGGFGASKRKPLPVLIQF